MSVAFEENQSQNSASTSKSASIVSTTTMDNPTAAVDGQRGSSAAKGNDVRRTALQLSVSKSQLLDDQLPQQLANEIEVLTGCAVWLVRVSPFHRVQESYAGRTASGWELSDDALSNLSSDSAQCTTPIATGLDPRIPLAKSAILDHIAESEAYSGVISFSHRMKEPEGSWVTTIAWRVADNAETALNVASWQDLNAATLGQSLEVWTQAKSGRKLAQWIQRCTQWRQLSRRTILAVVLAAAGILALPLPYRPTRDCTLEPLQRRFVASPIQGRLTSVNVRPGDSVIAGQLLAKMDDQPLIRDLSVAEAELQTANKKREIAMAARASGEIRLAQLECEQIELRMDALRDQLQRLEIIAPSNGVIVQGDWFGNEGMPVTLGQTLFEIAAMDQMIAEIQLLPEDLPYIDKGSVAIIRSESTGTQSWQGKLARVEPQAVIKDDKAVYVAEMELEQSSPLFRPGMEAKAVLHAGNKSVGWLLFRKPYRWLINQWIW